MKEKEAGFSAQYINQDSEPIKGGFFSERANWFFKSPNLQNKNIPKNYPELEI